MRRIDAVFLGCVFAAAGAVAWMSAAEAVKRLPGRAAAARPLGAAGQPREVDMERLEALIQAGRLSDHEAMYYKPVD